MLRKVVKVRLCPTSGQQIRQSIQYPQKVKVEGNTVKLPEPVSKLKAKIHRPISGTIKTITVSQEPSGKYYASIQIEIEGEHPKTLTEDRIIGVDLGLKLFAITSDGSKVSKDGNPKHLAKPEKNIKRKQQKLANKQKGSNLRNKYKKVVARIYKQVSNSRHNCYYQVDEMPLEMREWTCPSCGTHHDRHSNASTHIRAEGIRILQADGTAVSASGGEVRLKSGRKSLMRHSPLNLEAHTTPPVLRRAKDHEGSGQCWVVHL